MPEPDRQSGQAPSCAPLLESLDVGVGQQQRVANQIFALSALPSMKPRMSPSPNPARRCVTKPFRESMELTACELTVEDF